MKRYISGLLLIAALVTGCAITPESLKKVEQGEKLILSEGVSVVSYRGLNVRCEEGALPGIYTAEKQDDDGIYYFGSGRSIWNTNEAIQKTPRLRVGGIYLPKNSGGAPRFFYFFETEIQTVENISQYIQNQNVAALSNPSTPLRVGTATMVGNVLGGALVSAMLQGGVGKIEMFPPITDELVRQVIIGSKQTM